MKSTANIIKFFWLLEEFIDLNQFNSPTKTQGKRTEA